MIDIQSYKDQLKEILEKSVHEVSTILPSIWSEKKVIIKNGAYPGPLSYDLTPYSREIIDCLHPGHPARWIAVMKGSQLGFSSTVLMPAIGYIIENQPGNTLLTVGNSNLLEAAVEKLDLMIDGAGLRDFIRPSVQRKRSNKSGDTNVKKDFPFGYAMITTANNHAAIRQLDIMYGLYDDFEAARKSSKQSGDTRDMLEQRSAAYASKHKIYFISTPELKQGSNIEPAFLMGDQRYYHIPCPHCSTMIVLKFKYKKGDIEGGFVWDLHDDGRVVSGSVRYKCYECGDTFDDKNKFELLNRGQWIPTATPRRAGFYSYHISAWYAPGDMYSWEHYIIKYMEACPPNEPRHEDKYQVWVNQVCGETYDGNTDALKATEILKNTRGYKPGEVPELLSIADGNGPIRMLTCSIDMNGTVDDARLDYEILAWSDSGAHYSIDQGSIGTFIPREGSAKVKVDRVHWTYEFNKPNSVWPELSKILDAKYEVAGPNPREMSIFKAGLDCGHFSKDYAYPYIDSRPGEQLCGLKGDKESKYIALNIDKRPIKPALERPNLYIVEVGILKDELSRFMQLRWDSRSGEPQPTNFMNFPEPQNGKYGYPNYFAHFESEQRVIVKTNTGSAARWEKITSAHQNHFFDCRVYNLALRDIILMEIAKLAKMPKLTWRQLMDEMFPQPR